MPGHVMDAIEQGAQDRTNGVKGEPAIVGSRLVELMRMTPFPIGRENRRETRHVGAVMREAGRVGVGQPFGNIEPDMPGIPSVGKADVEQVRRQRELGDDARLIKHLVASIVETPVQ